MNTKLNNYNNMINNLNAFIDKQKVNLIKEYQLACKIKERQEEVETKQFITGNLIQSLWEVKGKEFDMEFYNTLNIEEATNYTNAMEKIIKKQIKAYVKKIAERMKFGDF